jgi:hypothetical protein
MADPITLSIVAIYVADKIVGKLISDKGTSALQKFFFPTKSYKNRLAKIIDETIKQFDSRYPKHNSKGRFRFYGSEIILTELSKHILFRTDYDTKIINSKIKENPNIIVPSENELAEFFELFVEKINNDSNLHELHVNETYKNKIFEISVQVHSSLQLLSEIRKKLMDDNLNLRLLTRHAM